MPATLQNDPPTTLGERLVAELARRGQHGRYFDFRAYQELKRIDPPAALQDFLARHGYRAIDAAAAPDSVADQLESLEKKRFARYTAIAVLAYMVFSEAQQFVETVGHPLLHWIPLALLAGSLMVMIWSGFKAVCNLAPLKAPRRTP